MSTYNIPLRNGYADLDLQRVADENTGKNAVIVFDENENPAVLLLSETFLKKFHPEDGIVIIGEALFSIWGDARYRVSNSAKLQVLNTGRDAKALDGFRYKMIPASAQVSAISEVNAAILHLQNRKVVKVLTF